MSFIRSNFHSGQSGVDPCFLSLGSANQNVQICLYYSIPHLASPRRSNRGGHTKSRKKDEPEDDGGQTRCVCNQQRNVHQCRIRSSLFLFSFSFFPWFVCYECALVFSSTPLSPTRLLSVSLSFLSILLCAFGSFLPFFLPSFPSLFFCSRSTMDLLCARSKMDG